MTLNQHTSYPPSFISNNMQIYNSYSGNSDFELRDHQISLVDHINVNQYSIVFSSRQMGTTSTIMANLLWHLTFRPGINIYITGNNTQATQQMFVMLLNMHTSLPSKYKLSLAPTIVSRYQTLTLSNGANLIAVPPDMTSSIIPMRADIVFVDLLSHSTQESTILNSYGNVVRDNGKIILTSSSVKRSSMFYAIWMDAKNKHTEFTPIEFTWQDNPVLDINWKLRMASKLGINSFAIEYENVVY